MNTSTIFQEVDWYLEIGERIRSARKDLGLTQEELAEVAGLKRASITHIENGKQKTSVYSLYLISNALKKPLVSLLPEVIKTEEQIVIDGKPTTVSPKAKTILEDLLGY